MSCITTTGKVEESFDSRDLSASYVAEFTPDGGVQIRIDVSDGAGCIASITRAIFTADQVDGWQEH